MDFRFIVISLSYLAVVLMIHLYLKDALIQEKFTVRNPETSDRMYGRQMSHTPLVVKTENTFDRGSIETSLSAHIDSEEKNKEIEAFQTMKQASIQQKEQDVGDEWAQYFQKLQTDDYVFEEVPTMNQLQKQHSSQLISESEIMNPTGVKQEISAFDEFELSPYKSFLEFSGNVNPLTTSA
jgi:hypothetical protein